MIAGDPNNDNVLWSGGSFQFAFAVSRSLNSGTTWDRYLLSMLGSCHAVAIAPSNSDVVYAGGSSYGGYPWFFKTTDRGASWDTVTGLTGDSLIRALAVHPSDPGIVYAGKSNGIFRSTNGGVTWTNTGLNNVNSIVIDPSSPETVYAGTTAGVYMSAAGGGGWMPINEGLDCLAITGLGIDIEHNLYAGTLNAGMYKWQINTAAGENQRHGFSLPLSVYPNPSRCNVRIDYHVARTGCIRIVVRDIQGRLVRTLVRNNMAAPGPGTAFWNGQDDKGRPVASGIYFCGFSSAGVPECIRTLVILR